MELRSFSHHTKDSYYRKAKEIVNYFEKPMMNQVTTKKLREFLMKYLKEEKKVSYRNVIVS